MAARRPLLIVVEDVHWIDPSSMEFLELLIDRIALAAGPGDRHDATAGGSAAYRRHAGSRHSPCRRSASGRARRWSAQMASDKPLPAALADEIVTKTEGVPLFVEELTKAVLDSDLLADRGDR